jgi:hypothetical protein
MNKRAAPTSMRIDRLFFLRMRNTAANAMAARTIPKLIIFFYRTGVIERHPSGMMESVRNAG